MLALQNEISEEDNARLIGTRQEVLVEGPSKTALKQTPDHFHERDREAAETPATEQHTQLVGRSRCDRIVVFEGNRRLVGTLAQVEIHDCTSTTLIGSIVTREFQHGTGNSLLPILG
jgi:tRNA-2-methylthio-N6-dimethylallyladenosine synthase